VTLTREKFEELNQTIFDETIEIVKRVLAAAGTPKTSIDDIVLVGGSSRIPKLQAMLTDFFGGKKLDMRIRQDEAVAYGAAINAAILNGNIALESGHFTRISDVTPRSLGTDILGDRCVIIIPRFTKTPTTMEDTFYTTDDNQTEVLIEILEGEDPVASRNHKLGKFILRGIPPALIGAEPILVSMTIDENGILSVSATVSSTRGHKSLTIEKKKYCLGKQALNYAVTIINYSVF
jgi:molecular chaperone DnaK (HSP70)